MISNDEWLNLYVENTVNQMRPREFYRLMFGHVSRWALFGHDAADLWLLRKIGVVFIGQQPYLVKEIAEHGTLD